MRTLSITLKDLTQSSRTFSAYVFMFVIPILVTLLFFFMFGSAGDEAGFNLPRTKTLIVNLDQGRFPDEFSFTSDINGRTSINLDDAQNMGDILTTILLSENFADLMAASELKDETRAREAVDQQEAGVAIILPPNFTRAISGQEIDADAFAVVEIYRDPTLSIGPAVVESVTSQILEAFSANNIGISIALDQLNESGVPASPALTQQLLIEFTSDSTNQGLTGFGSSADLVQLQSLSGEGESRDLVTQIVSVILAGMMVFFAFFTGSASMESILIEEERGTLARLFTTPNSNRTILGGKAIAVFITLVIQVTALLTFGRFVFNIDWGEITAIILASVGLVLVAATTGLFLVSFLKNTRQSGIVFGGVLTLTGMLGLMPVFTAGVPNQPEALQIISLLVPQGWAIRGYTIALEGGSVSEVLPVFGVLLLWSIVFAGIGQYRLQRRFA